MKKIDTNRYGDYIITDNSFGVYCPFERGRNTRVICGHIFKRQHQQMTQIFIPLCKNCTDRYHLNILRTPSII